MRLCCKTIACYSSTFHQTTFHLQNSDLLLYYPFDFDNSVIGLTPYMNASHHIIIYRKRSKKCIEYPKSTKENKIIRVLNVKALQRFARNYDVVTDASDRTGTTKNLRKMFLFLNTVTF